ncbi:nuclear transport factor 2 family protein [Aureivirga marina]|uniref:nuclear transport factor 2 family protein n=1 Tax=Aureivirga marina TaxID=1182451 RepID=UPI0018CA3D5A|nr:nuclear transport factor 2 family protein [Aureivirga marina]
MFKEEITKIEKLISTYFEGIYEGNVQKLETCFDSKTQLYGIINENFYFKNISEYLESVKTRKSPKELKESFQMKILGIEILGEIAMVKAHVPMLEYNYYDYLTLIKVGNQWKITHKIFTNIIT